MIKGTIELDEKALEDAVKMFIESRYGLKATTVLFASVTNENKRDDYYAVATYVPVSKLKPPSTSDWNCK